MARKSADQAIEVRQFFADDFCDVAIIFRSFEIILVDRFGIAIYFRVPYDFCVLVGSRDAYLESAYPTERAEVFHGPIIPNGPSRGHTT